MGMSLTSLMLDLLTSHLLDNQIPIAFFWIHHDEVTSGKRHDPAQCLRHRKHDRTMLPHETPNDHHAHHDYHDFQVDASPPPGLSAPPCYFPGGNPVNPGAQNG